MKRNLLLLPGFALIVLGAYLFLGSMSCRELSCISFKEKASFRVQTVYETDKKAYRALWSNGRLQLRIEKYVSVTAEQAKEYDTYKSMQIEGLYEDAKSPYPGVLSDRIRCEGKYKPVFEVKTANGVNKATYTGYLNDRLQYGICVEEELAYVSQAAMFYCPKQQSWYQLEFIAPYPKPSALSDYVNSIRCN